MLLGVLCAAALRPLHDETPSDEHDEKQTLVKYEKDSELKKSLHTCSIEDSEKGYIHGTVKSLVFGHCES